MKLIVGLGNPDVQYKNTFHNLGFMCADETAKKLSIQFNKQKCRAEIAEAKIGNEKVIVAKPLTYMNLSGESVRELMNFYKIDKKDLMVIYDDFDIEVGTIRIRENGSAGTHNGMRNIISLLGSGEFCRVRVGFKPQGEFNIPLINYVLSGIKDQDRPIFSKAIDVASDCAVDFANGKTVQQIMQRYNGKIEV